MFIPYTVCTLHIRTLFLASITVVIIVERAGPNALETPLGRPNFTFT